MLMPKRVKRRKQFRGSMRGKALRGNKINYGEFGLVATEPCWIRSNQIEAARVAMTRWNRQKSQRQQVRVQLWRWNVFRQISVQQAAFPE